MSSTAITPRRGALSFEPLLPAIDAAGRLREAGFAVLVRDRRPLGLDDLARVTGLEFEAVCDITATLAGAGWLDLFCTPTVLLCGEAHGAVWAEAQARRGRLLNLAEGARQGGLEWAGCAEARRRLA